MNPFLIVEDDKQISKFLSFSLHSQDFVCLEASTGKEAMQLISSTPLTAIILDLGLPDMDGLDIIRNVREFSQIPIIVVSARDQDHEKVTALDSGADDYLTKPFSMNELMARIRVILRHHHKSDQTKQPVFEIRELIVDDGKHRVTLREKEIHLTPMEYDILLLLVKNSGKVLTHRYILKEIWNSYLDSDMQSLRVFMANIRRKIEKEPAKPEYLFTEVGIGYRFAEE